MIARPLAAVPLTDLVALGRVDPDQPDPLSRELEGVAVDHAGRLGDCSGSRDEQGDGKELEHRQRMIAQEPSARADCEHSDLSPTDATNLIQINAFLGGVGHPFEKRGFCFAARPFTRKPNG